MFLNVVTCDFGSMAPRVRIFRIIFQDDVAEVLPTSVIVRLNAAEMLNVELCKNGRPSCTAEKEPWKDQSRMLV